MLKTRIITAVCLLAVLLGAIFFLPPLAWNIFCALICALAAWEWGGLAGWSGKTRIVYAVVLGITLILLLLLQFSVVFFMPFALCLIASVFWLLIVPFWLRYKWPLQKRNAAWVGFIVLVPAIFVFSQLLLLLPPRSYAAPLFLISIIALVWVADIAAYFTGRAFGGRKLAPNISPGKTWAGAIGAVIGVLLYCNTLLVFVVPSDSFEKTYLLGHFTLVLLLQLVFIGLAVMSIVGDLFESMLKRQAGVKDSSHLLPGHGGILDRIDSLTSTLPLIGTLYYMVAILSFL
jgi:phosphatidate cytidylyltransferase